MSKKTGAAQAQQTKPAKVEEVNPVLANEDVEALKAEHPTKSSLIRAMVGKGYEIRHIAKAFTLRYQHVRNVATTPLMSEEKEKRAAAKALAEADKTE